MVALSGDFTIPTIRQDRYQVCTTRRRVDCAYEGDEDGLGALHSCRCARVCPFHFLTGCLCTRKEVTWSKDVYFRHHIHSLLPYFGICIFCLRFSAFSWCWPSLGVFVAATVQWREWRRKYSPWSAHKGGKTLGLTLTCMDCALPEVSPFFERVMPVYSQSKSCNIFDCLCGGFPLCTWVNLLPLQACKPLKQVCILRSSHSTCFKLCQRLRFWTRYFGSLLQSSSVTLTNPTWLSCAELLWSNWSRRGLNSMSTVFLVRSSPISP